MDNEHPRTPGGSGDPLIGRLLDRRYEILQAIARGGMATVYLATDTRLQRRVAVKVMHPAMAQDAEFVARFDREARSAAAIDHPNVVSVTDQGHDGDVVFLVMEFVQGRTLRNLLNEKGRLTPAEALEIMEPLLDALGAAHDAGIVHRDIKPENVLLANDGRVKITDFGLARAIESTPITMDTSLLLGTVAYLAPEQVSHGIADSRSDVYACGVLFFELITGSAPHTASTPIAVAYKHVNDDIPAPSSLVPGIPDALDEIVLEATSRDPQERPENGHELLGLLRRAKPSILAASAAMTSAMTTQMARNATTRIDTSGAHTTVTRTNRGATMSSNDTDAHYLRDAGFFGRMYWRYRQHLIGWTALLLALLLVATGGWWLGSGRFASAPNLVGLSVSAAEQTAQRHGLKIIQAGEKTYSESVAVGLVADQRPGKGKHVKRHGTITLIISQGALRYPVPQVQGKTLEDARNALLAGHMKVGSSSETFDDTVPTGRVAKTNPVAGTRVKDNTTVAIIVSKGPQPINVPNVVGKASDDATKTLNDASFKVTIKRAYSEKVDRDKVISQDKTGQAPKGSTVEITVSDGPEMVIVPDLTGMTREKATATLSASGLKAEIVNIPGEDNVVVSQSPRAKRKVRAGSTVTVYVR